MLTPSVLVVRTTLAGVDAEGFGAANDPDLLAVVEGGGDRAVAGTLHQNRIRSSRQKQETLLLV